MGGAVSGITDAISDAGSFLDDAAHQAAPIVGAYYGIPPSVTNAALNIGSSSGGGQSLASSYLPTSGYQPYGASPTGYGGSPQPIYINNAPAQQQQPSMFSQLLPFLMQAGGGVAQQQVNKDAAQQQADALRAAGQQAAQASQFRPVGTTTRFGSSNYQVDPATGQLISAGYNASPLAQGYQDQLAGMTSQGLMQGQQIQGLANQYLASQQGQPVSALGQQYLGESPEAIRQRYMQQQTALLAPGNEQKLAEVRNNLFQTGRQGLATGATSAGGLAATNPEMAAYYNSIANQQRQIAAGADTAAQTQAKLGADLYGAGLGMTQKGQQFGQDLGAAAYSPFTAGFGAQGAVETAAQQPMGLSTSLASQFQQANQTGAKYNLEAQKAAADAMLRANQVSPFADIMTALGKTPTATTAIGGAVGGLLGGLFGGNTAQAGQPNIQGGGVDLSGLGNIFSSDALNFGGWNSGGTSVYNPDAFSLSGNYGGGWTDAFNLGDVDFSSWM